MHGRLTIALAAGMLAATLAAPAGAATTATVDGSLAATSADGTVDLDRSAAVPYDGGYAVPLRAEPPAWLTEDLIQQVVDADGPVPVPAEAGPDVPVSGFAGIRPGSWMVLPAWCTMNFIFSNDGDLAIGTAGHCVDGDGGPRNGNGNGGDGNGNGNGKGNGNDDGDDADAGDECNGNSGRERGGDECLAATAAAADPVILVTVAPGGDVPVLVELGPVLVHRDNGVGDDFALIAIPEQYHDWVFPTIAQVLGPCGAYTGSGPETVGHYGHGVGIGTGGTPRVGVALTWRDDAYGWSGAATPGDSGSAVRVTDLQAAGNLTHLVVDPDWVPSYIAGTRITEILDMTGQYSLDYSGYCP